MQVVLLERVEKLGQMGEVVNVKEGFARNFLLPRKKALRATKDNLAHFEAQRAQLEAQNLEQKSEAEGVGEKLDGQSFIAIRQASEGGQLYGSVSTRDIATLLTENGFTSNRSQVELDKPIKELGVYTVRIRLHPEVTANVDINVARSEEEAERQARGEDVTAKREDDLETDLELGYDPDMFDESGRLIEGGDEEEAQEASADGDDTEEETKTE